MSHSVQQPGTSGGSAGSSGAGNGGAAAKGAAVVLWAIVGGGLAYGVTQTVIKAAQLFS